MLGLREKRRVPWLMSHEPRLCSAISSHQRASRWRHGLQLYEAAARVDVACFNAAVSGARRAQWAQVLRWLRVLPKGRPDVVSHSTVMSCQSWHRSLALFQAMPEAQVRPDLVSCNAAIRGTWQRAALLLALVKGSLQPNIISYTAVVSSFAQEGQWRRAVQLFGRVCAETRPNVVSYSATISACEKGGRWHEALRLFSAMPPESRDLICFSAAISACEKGGMWQQALWLFQAMPHCRDLISFNATLSSLAQGGKWQQGLWLLELMRTRATEPDLISYSAAICCCEAGNWLHAMSLLEAMLLAKLRPDVATYNAAITSCQRSGAWRHALQLLVAMSEAEVDPDDNSYNAAISSCETRCERTARDDTSRATCA